MAQEKGFHPIDVVILCGGLGKRLRSQIGEKQKTMTEISGMPFLQVLLKSLDSQGFHRFILCTGYQSEQVEEYFRKAHEDFEIIFSSEPSPLGTGGAMKHAQPFVKSNPFIAMNGDCFCPMDFQTLLDFHQEKKSTASLVVSPVKNAEDFGTITIDGDGRILNFQEKIGKGPSLAFVNAGIYCFDQRIFSLMPKEPFSIEKDFFPRLVTERFYGLVVQEPFIDIGTPERLQLAQRILRRGVTRGPKK